MVLLDSTGNYHSNAYILRSDQDIKLSFTPIPSGTYTVIVHEISENNRSCNHSFETVVNVTISLLNYLLLEMNCTSQIHNEQAL